MLIHFSVLDRFKGSIELDTFFYTYIIQLNIIIRFKFMFLKHFNMQSFYLQ